MRHPAEDVAKYILASFGKQDREITKLKLQKLVYYSQAWALGIDGTPIFDEPIEAWVHGPVAPSVFREYRNFRWLPIRGVPYGHTPLSRDVAEHVDIVLDAYGTYDAYELEPMTHAEDPGKMPARGGAPGSSLAPI